MTHAEKLLQVIGNIEEGILDRTGDAVGAAFSQPLAKTRANTRKAHKAIRIAKGIASYGVDPLEASVIKAYTRNRHKAKDIVRDHKAQVRDIKKRIPNGPTRSKELDKLEKETTDRLKDHIQTRRNLSGKKPRSDRSYRRSAHRTLYGSRYGTRSL